MRKIFILFCLLLPVIIMADTNKYELYEPNTEYLLKNGIDVKLKLTGSVLYIKKQDQKRIEHMLGRRITDSDPNAIASVYVPYLGCSCGDAIYCNEPLGIYQKEGIIPIILRTKNIEISYPDSQAEKARALIDREMERIRNLGGCLEEKIPQTLLPQKDYIGKMVPSISILQKPMLEILEKNKIKYEVLREGTGVMVKGKDLKRAYKTLTNDMDSFKYETIKNPEEFVCYGIFDNLEPHLKVLLANGIEVLLKPNILYTVYVPYENLAEAKRLLMNEAEKGTLFEQDAKE